MKKKKELEIHFKSFKEFFDSAERALAKRKPLIQPKNHIVFETVEGFRNFMTVQKVEILSAIYNCEPKTIYELARIVNRDFAAVLRDCTELKTTGFISLKERKDAKRSKWPLLAFPYVCISVNLPSALFILQLGAGGS